MRHSPFSAPLASILASLLFVQCAGQEASKPDVLLVVIDTLRADRLGCYGYDRGLTPVMDDLAAKGSVFLRASSQAAWTLPSMCSLVSSQYPTRQKPIPDLGRPTLAETFQKAGYATIGVVANCLLDPLPAGKQDDPNNQGTRVGGFERGFDTYIPRMGANGQRKSPGHFDAVASWIEPALIDAVRTDENGNRKPLFFYIHPSDPHTPYHGKRRMLADQPVSTVPPILPLGWQLEQLKERGPTPRPDDPDWSKALSQMQEIRNDYDHEVRTADEALGRLLERLKSLGVSDNLIVAILSDHGEELFENVTLAKPETLREMAPAGFFFQTHRYSLHEQELRTPFILSGPGVKQGGVFSEPVENVDLFPTLASLCGLDRPDDLHGVDLTPLMNGRADPDQWRTLTYAWVDQSVTVRDEQRQLKLVLPTPNKLYEGIVKPQFFDLKADPLERHNLWPQRKDECTDLTRELLAYLNRYDVTPFNLTKKDLADLMERFKEGGYSTEGFENPEEQGPIASRTRQMFVERGYLED